MKMPFFLSTKHDDINAHQEETQQSNRISQDIARTPYSVNKEEPNENEDLATSESPYSQGPY